MIQTERKDEMERRTEEFKRLIFDLMNGSLVLENNPPEESKYVETEFAEGKECEKAYLPEVRRWRR